ncbi:DNA adenine methylase [Salmonella enterica]|uniref:DNA adenine methylase n=1 Tax=Vibrio vulnificus TaxID=672 RepID=UPI001286E4D0|nr:DNA adenine methylase [Vibrio vulnificus]EAZ2875435.1 DNA adenine methylase [Salmonella enterica]HCG9011233.1 DNA adenine methylase [Vibrio parahaemolyticus]EBK6743103.1 DNA adenine methylase [Salmonella enterica]EBM1056867.1 DNA adenine methylase [Salmonella enterica]ELN1085013.1 DNA adenine methylase [Salmonella enterica]
MSNKPFFSWMGGKRRLAKHILPEFPEHECYVEPFCGAAALFFMKMPTKVEVINDVNSDLVNLYRVVQHHLEEFVRQFKWALISREMFKWLDDTPVETLTDIQRAARFYYLQQMGFGAKITGRTFGTATTTPPKLNLLRLEETLSQAHLRLSRVYVEHLDWQACMEKYDRPHTLFYLDPPYWQTEGYGVDFPFEQYERMAEMARTVKGKVVISINDHPDIRKAFAGFRMQEVSLRHTVGGRAGKQAGELIIFNW